MIDAKTLDSAAQAASETALANHVSHRSFSGSREEWCAVVKSAVRELAAHGYVIQRPQAEVKDDV